MIPEIKKIFRLLFCAVAALVVVVVLYTLMDKFKIYRQTFTRLFPPRITERKKIFDLGVNSYYFSGATNSRTYLGNYSVPGLVLELDSALSDTIRHRFPLRQFPKLSVGTHATIDSPAVYFTDGITASLLLSSLQHPEKISLDTGNRPFTTGYIVSPGSLIVRQLDDSLHQQVLVKFNRSNQLSSQYILEKQIDGIFSTDGMLVQARESHSLLYSFFYRNEFIRLDTNLKVIYKAHTIDTTRKAAIKILDDKSRNTSVLAGGSLMVNKRSFVYKDLILIQSGIMAANELEDLFNECSVLDVYNLSDGKYKFSFYLPDFKKKKVRDFIVAGKSLYALQDQYVLRYDLNFEGFASPK